MNEAAADRLAPIDAVTYRHSFSTNSKPAIVRCADNEEYVVKGEIRGREGERIRTNDHIVGRLGGIIGAPVGEVAVVNLPDELILLQPEMAHFHPGLAHGSKWIPDVTERDSIRHERASENRRRFALLAVLYGWAGAYDRQMIYGDQPPHLVYSVDHGHFFPGNISWTIQNLQNAPMAAPDPQIVSTCRLTPAELTDAVDMLSRLDSRRISALVAGIPDAWEIDMDDRVAMAHYLGTRRCDLLNGYGS